MKKICVIGSLNIDLTIFVPRFHAPGETISGSAFHIFPGGKGGNQAVALARLGADVAIVGCLGNDANGAMYLKQLNAEHVDCSMLHLTDQVESGVALIEVCTETGDNRIALSAGANMLVDIRYLDAIMDRLLSYDVFLLQLEIPIEAVEHACAALKACRKTILLDPAPSRPLTDTLLRCVTYITPNETELGLLTDMPVETDTQIKAAAKALIARGAGAVVVKLGARGSMLVKPDGCLMMPGFSVNAVDTTAAGDSFNAGLAFALSNGLDESASIRFANGVGALSTTALGAQSAMPSRNQVEQLLA